MYHKVNFKRSHVKKKLNWCRTDHGKKCVIGLADILCSTLHLYNCILMGPLELTLQFQCLRKLVFCTLFCDGIWDLNKSQFKVASLAYMESNIKVGMVRVTRFASLWKIIQLNQNDNSDVVNSSICWSVYFV